MIVLRVKVLRSFREKSIGLIGKKQLFPVYFTTRFGLHTFGVRSPLDILILDKDKRVVKIKSRLSPNRLFFWSAKYQDVVELPPGEIEKKGIKIGDQIVLRLERNIVNRFL